MKPLNTPSLSALGLAVLLPFAAAAQSQHPSTAQAQLFNAKATLATAKVPAPKPRALLASTFNPLVGSKLISTMEQMTAALLPVTEPAHATPAMAKIQQIWPIYLQLDKAFSLQLEQIAAAEQAGKKTPDMQTAETTTSTSLTVRGLMLEVELLRVSKLPLAATDMSLVHTLHRALTE